MTNEEIARQKFEILLNAVEEANKQTETNENETAAQQQSLETFLQQELEAGDPIMEDLKAAAFEVLLLNPGSDRGDWAQTLVEQYGDQVIDAYGENPQEVYHGLSDLWDAPYYDHNSGLEYDFSEWAAAFSTEQSVQLYNHLTKALNEAKNALKQVKYNNAM